MYQVQPSTVSLDGEESELLQGFRCLISGTFETMATQKRSRTDGHLSKEQYNAGGRDTSLSSSTQVIHPQQVQAVAVGV